MRQTANAVTELSARIAVIADGPDRAALVHELCARFVIHVQAEERYLHPAVRHTLSDGDSMTADQTRRDRAVEGTIECVERRTPQDEEFEALVSLLVVGVQDHVEQQDTVLLPALIGTCSIEEINLLGRQLRHGIPAVRQAAERAGARAAGEPADGSSPCAGFRALLQRIARGPAADVVG
jgi:hypothetical protein